MPATAQRQIVADIAEPARIDWFGNEGTDDAESFDEYLERVPSREDLKAYPVPVMYWEVKHPGCAIQPFPRMGQFRSLQEGVWLCQNRAMEDSVREHLRVEMRRDPDDFKLTEEDVLTMKARTQNTVKYCRSCAFMTCDFEMSNLHEELTGHIQQSKPRDPNAYITED